MNDDGELPADHPHRDEIEKYCEPGFALDVATVDAIEKHLVFCPDCSRAVSQIVRRLWIARKRTFTGGGEESSLPPVEG
jgi:hypothetical protein